MHSVKRLIAVGVSGLAALGSVALSVAPAAADATSSALANAIAGNGITVTGSSFVTQANPSTTDVRTDAVAGFPTTPGGDYAAISTGRANSLTQPNSSASLSTDFFVPKYRGTYDTTTLKIDFTVAPGFNCLASLKMKFLSEEYPEFVGSEFNDAAIIELDANDWSLSGNDVVAPANIAFYGANPVTVNTTGPAAASPANSAGTTFDAATPILSARSPISPGPHSLYITIFDVSDDIFDSTVLLDDLSVATVSDPAAQCPRGAFSTEVNPPNRFVPVSPARIVDSRIGLGLPTVVAANTPTAVQATGLGGVPANGVAAVVVNVTVTGTQGVGYVKVTPAGGTSDVSSLNVESVGQTLPNLVTVPVSPTGMIDVFSQSSTDVIIDVFGYYTAAAAATAGRFIAVDPNRVLDTRIALGVTTTTPVPPGGAIDIQVTGTPGVPSAGISAVVLNLTATGATGAGYVTVWPTGQAQPSTSNINLARSQQTIANQVIVPIGAGGKVSIFTQSGSHLLADVAGYFTDSTAPLSSTGLFIPVTPTRLLDTRSAIGVATTTIAAGGQTVETAVIGRGGIPGTGASALIGNTTATQTVAPGYVTVFPKSIDRPTSSTVNAEFTNQTIANHTVVRINDGGVSLFTQTGSHLLLDVSGFYTQ